MTIDDPSLREHLLAFADDEHLMGQGHTEWIGVAPFLEEDMAFVLAPANQNRRSWISRP